MQLLSKTHAKEKIGLVKILHTISVDLPMGIEDVLAKHRVASL